MAGALKPRPLTRTTAAALAGCVSLLAIVVLMSFSNRSEIAMLARPAASHVEQAGEASAFCVAAMVPAALLGI